MSDEVKNGNTSTEGTVETAERTVDSAVLEEMTKAGMLLGRRRSKTNPKMKKHIYANRNGFEIIDLAQTVDMIAAAGEFLKSIATKGQQVLVVGTEPAAKLAVKKFADRFGFPFVTERWLGGTLTNYEVITTRLKYFMGLKADQAAGRLDKYTKKERVLIDKKITKLNTLFGGLERIARMPAALVVVNAGAHEAAIAEAKIMKVPVIAVASTNANPDKINYLVLANDNGVASIGYVLNKFEDAFEEGVKAAKVAATTLVNPVK